MSKYSFTLDSFKNIQELIRFMDQKSSAILVIFGFILTAFVNNASKLHFVNPFLISPWNGFLSSCTLLVGVSTLALLLYKIRIIINEILKPRVAKHYLPEHYSLFYYGHIKLMEKERYLEEVENMPENQAEQELAAQVYEVSQILSSKTESLNKVMSRMFYLIGLLLTFIFLSQLV
ncbi:unknown protein [Paenibacillus amylolyticus]|uniref:Pycsar effector protein domain-containing protein n=1 Tax=Paenibacillus amylolyticus TaxID=1451 RepID=A0A117I381_PAEAM|nr:unknown protein [Paenibacillus amylolyticus]